MSATLVFDASALITAARFEVEGTTILDHILPHYRVVIPETVKVEVVDAGLQGHYADAVLLAERVKTGVLQVITTHLAAGTFQTVLDCDCLVGSEGKLDSRPGSPGLGRSAVPVSLRLYQTFAGAIERKFDMNAQISVVLDDKIIRYVETQQTIQHRPPSELVADLLNEWYESKLQNLHEQYLAGNLTLRGMARQLGLDYRELYDLMEKKGLTL